MIAFQLCSNFPQWSHLVKTDESWWDLACLFSIYTFLAQVRPKNLQLWLLPGNSMPMLLSGSQPAAQFLPLSPLEATYPKNHPKWGGPVTFHHHKAFKPVFFGTSLRCTCLKKNPIPHGHGLSQDNQQNQFMFFPNFCEMCWWCFPRASLGH